MNALALAGPEPLSVSPRAARHDLRVRIARRSTIYPAWWLWAAASVAWAALVLFAATGSPLVNHAAIAPSAGAVIEAGGGHTMGAVADASDAARALPWTGSWVAMWMLMVVAMMWPLYASSAAAVARSTYRRWRVPAVAAYLGTITALWVVAGLEARAVVVEVVPAGVGRLWTVGWLFAAMALSRSLWRARLLRSCGRRTVIAPRGQLAISSAARAARRDWPRCALLCGPVMLAMAGTHNLAIMVAGSGAVWWEQRHPRALRDPIAVALLGLAATVAFVQAL